MSGIIFDISHYSIYDGPGIRTTVFFKGCPLRCFWCQNPESQKSLPEIGYLAEKCRGCYACTSACSHGAVKIVDGRAVHDRKSCVSCGACAKVCSHGATTIIGAPMRAEEIVERIIRDEPFYQTSGGGATFSGGEATAQKELLFKVLAELKKRGVHTAIETCGFFDSGQVAELAELVDLFLYDLKHADEKKHHEYTGVSNKKILQNFHDILALVGPERIIPRIPLIPGANDSDEEIGAILDFLEQAGFRGEVHLMPYNRLYKTKWEKIGRPEEYRDLGEIPDERLDEIAELVRRRNFEPFINH